jgi:hypothetical protein
VSENLDFVADWDLDAFKKDCENHRVLAKFSPVVDKNMVLWPEYHWRLGRWHLAFMKEVWRRPVWHGSVTVFDEVGHRLVDVKRRLEVPHDEWLTTTDWEPKHLDQARFLLAQMFGPILRPNDKHQPALETRAFKALHWHIPVD